MLGTQGLCWQQLLMMAVWCQFSLPSTSNPVYPVSALPPSLYNQCSIQVSILLPEDIILFMVVVEEAERITQSNGRIFCLHDEPGVYRVWMPNGKRPGLALSRAFGDYCVKDFGLSSIPDVTQRSIRSKDQFVILATDGVCLFLDIISHHKRITFKFSLSLCLTLSFRNANFLF